MTAIQIRKQLHNYVDKLDDLFLKSVYSLIKTYVADKDKVIGYTIQGDPLTKEILDKSLQDTESEIAEGKIISHRSLKQETKQWRKKAGK